MGWFNYMDWFNYIGLIIIVAFLIPNVDFAATHKDGFENKFHNKTVEVLEQIGRFGCFIFMIINIPYTYFGFYSDGVKLAYIVINGVLTLAYDVIWGIMWKRAGLLKSILLSAVPSVIFIFSGVTIASVPLMIFAIIFAPTHILISVKNSI